jgi:DMSO/TMAO reductase YedYZ molybdopterin-dependent catalytic subunit
MKDVLQRAGVNSNGRHVLFKGLDEPPGKVPPFLRSIPLEKAMDPDTLLAMQMNGSPLLKHHGYPVRALVPGWIGAASCKWLAEIRVLDREFDGNFMKPGYRMPNQPVVPGGEVNVADTTAITRLYVKSIFTRPADGRKVKVGASVPLSGAAWAGDAEVAKVEISPDNGQTWQPARLGREQAKYAWRFWQYAWKPAVPGAYVLIVRAIDGLGRTQPTQAPWNPSGYLWNGFDRIKMYAEAA